MSTRPQWREPEVNTTYLVDRALAHLQSRILGGVMAAGHTSIRPSHTAVFVNIDHDGTRLTHLAERATMTPQAMGELVDDLVGKGYLVRVPDPTDRRAKLITLTDRGNDAVQAAFDTIIDLESGLEELLGRSALRTLQKALGRIGEVES